jgi:WhiB family redox-sensing transcriptional regulator
MLLAACRGMPTEMWFPAPGNVPEVAYKVCNGCDVREERLTYGLAEGFGIWGGLSERRRRKIRRRRAQECHAEEVTVAEDLVVVEPSGNGDFAPLEPQNVRKTAPTVPGETVGVRICARPGCDNPLPPKASQWCSRSCQKKVAHQRSRERLQAAQDVTNEVVETRSAKGLGAPRLYPCADAGASGRRSRPGDRGGWRLPAHRLPGLVMPSGRLLEHNSFAAEVHHRLTEWEIADWLQSRDEQLERAARPAPRDAEPTGPMLYRNGGRILYIR